MNELDTCMFRPPVEIDEDASQAKAESRRDEYKNDCERLYTELGEALDHMTTVMQQRDLWKARCKEAQRCLEEVMEVSSVQMAEWNSARDAGKDE